MPKFSEKSLEILNTCEEDIQVVMMDVIVITDIKIISGLRGEEEQNWLFRSGLSRKMFPNSRHNSESGGKSQAVDIAPFPVNWKDEIKFYYVAGIVKGVAGLLGIELRWGGDWDMDDDLHDQTFMDLGHFELVR